jgi:hypothetical protein
MADGSAKRTTEAPGYFDDRAIAYDTAIARALETGDAGALAALDQDLAVELWVAGARPLATLGDMTKDATITAQMRANVAPLGVGYWVANWSVS